MTDRVHWPSAIVRVTPLYWLCGRLVYLRVAFLHHYIHAANVCEKFVNCERIFCMNPVYSLWARHDSQSVGFSCELSFVMIWLARAAQVIVSPKPSVIPHETGFLNSLYIASPILYVLVWLLKKMFPLKDTWSLDVHIKCVPLVRGC